MLHLAEIEVTAALQQTLEFLQSNERIIADWFGGEDGRYFGAAYSFITAWNPENIGPAYQEDQQNLSAITVLNGGVRPIDQYVGGYLGEELSSDRTSTSFYRGERQQTNVSLEIATLNRTELSFMLGFINGTMLLHRQNFDELGLNNMEFSSEKAYVRFNEQGLPIYLIDASVSFESMAAIAETYGPTPWSHAIPITINGLTP